MKPIRFLFILLGLMLINPALRSQDKLILTDGKIIECKVTEIGSDEIKYTVTEYESDVIIGIKKSKVDKIVFANGKEMVIDHLEEAKESMETNSGELFQIQKRNALKMEFLSPLNSVLAFSFERCIKPGSSWEATLGIVGIGFENPDDAMGFAVKGRYKMIKSPDFYIQGMRYAHILKGKYLAPELLFATYHGTSSGWEGTEEYTRVKFAALINLGNQWVFNNSFLIDLYFGLGYGYSNNEEFASTFPYVFSVAGENFPLAFSWGFRIGFLIK
jgi:hypothetical protein